MTGFHLNNAIKASGVGITAFILLLWWSPLKKPISQSSIAPAVPRADASNLETRTGKTAKREIDSEYLEKLCAASARIQSDPEGYERTKNWLRTLKDGPKNVDTLDKIDVLLDTHCVNGKPRQ